MKYSWLNKKNNDKLIIFFNGWGMDDFIVSHLDCEDYDIINFYDYTSLDININFNEYKEKHIVAWSMGVMVATLFDFGEVKTKTALCGTPYPINNEYGIPKRIYELTIKGFSEQSAKKFMDRMFTEPPTIERFSNRGLENQKEELIKLLDYKSNNDYKYTKAIIPDKDLIIPTKNQIKYWENTDTKYIIIPSGHCPFYNYKTFSDIIVDI